MKHKLNSLKFMLLFAVMLLLQTIALAQDSTMQTTQTNTNTTTTQTTWYLQPWVWIVGGIVLLLILIGLFRGRSTVTSSDRVVVTKTVERDVDN